MMNIETKFFMKNTKLIFSLTIVVISISVGCSRGKKEVVEYYYPKTTQLPPEERVSNTTVAHDPSPIPHARNSSAPELPKTFHVELKDAPVREAIEAVCRQSNYRCDYLAGSSTKRLTMTLNGTLKEVLQVITAQADMIAEINQEIKTVRIDRAGETTPRLP